jgi:hypothetical protein
MWSQDSSVGIAMGYGLNDQGSILSRGKRFFSSSSDVKLNTHLHPMQRSRTVQLYLHSPYVFMAWYIIN